MSTSRNTLYQRWQTLAYEENTVSRETYQHYQQWQAQTLPSTPSPAEALAASQAWCALAPGARAKQLHMLVQALRHAHPLLSMAESEHKRYPLRFVEQALKAALQRPAPPTLHAAHACVVIDCDATPQLSYWLPLMLQSLARGCAVMVVARAASTMPQAQPSARAVVAEAHAHVPARLVSYHTKMPSGNISATLPRDCPALHYDSAVLSAQADLESSLHTLVRQVVALRRPLRLLVQEAVLESVHSILGRQLQQLRQGEPLDYNSDMCPPQPDAPSCYVIAEPPNPPEMIAALRGASIMLSSFRRMSDVAAMLAPSEHPSLWSHDALAMLSFVREQQLPQLYLNRVPGAEICGSYQPVPASLRQGASLEVSSATLQTRRLEPYADLHEAVSRLYQVRLTQLEQGERGETELHALIAQRPSRRPVGQLALQAPCALEPEACVLLVAAAWLMGNEVYCSLPATLWKQLHPVWNMLPWQEGGEAEASATVWYLGTPQQQDAPTLALHHAVPLPLTDEARAFLLAAASRPALKLLD